MSVLYFPHMESEKTVPAHPLTVGDTVPNLSLKAFHKDDIRDLSLETYRGKWIILFFYPADFTFVCPTELGELADRYDEFQQEGIEVLSVSTDTAFAHKAWCDRSDTVKKVTFPMISDASHSLSALFGVLSGEGTARRATFIINPKGVIMASEVVDDHISRDAGETLRKVRALKHTHANRGEVTPAGWKKTGDRILKPGVELIGAV